MTFEESKRKFAKTIKDKYEKEYGKDLDIEEVISVLDCVFQEVSTFTNNLLDCKFVRPIELDKTNEKL